MLKKRGQITVFIIVGIILLVSIGLILGVRSITKKNQLTPELIPSITSVPSELRPIRLFIENCLYDVSEEALVKLGSQGGYINPEAAGMMFSHFDPTSYSGIQFSENSQLKIPFWWHMKSANDCGKNTPCVFESLRPKLYRESGTETDFSIEAQIDRHVNEKIKDCLGNFEFFKEQGFEIELDEAKTTTQVGEYDVSIFLEFPIELKRGDVSHKIDTFYVLLPVNLKHMYDFATDITNMESKDAFLEQLTLNSIGSFQGLDKNKLPPRSATSFELGGGIFWSVPKIKKDIENILMSYMPSLQVPFSLNYERRSFPSNPLKEGTYAAELPLNFDFKYEDLEARFDYLGWPLYFHAGDGTIIKPESVKVMFLPLGIQRYSTTYDISFPAMITVTDPYALNNKGYSFIFGLESNLRNNERITADFEGLDGAFLFQPSLFCNVNQKNSGEIIIRVEDVGSSDNHVDEVAIYYTCGDETCPVGKTDETGVLKEKIPLCLGGFLSFEKPGYNIPIEYLTTELDKEDAIIAKAYPKVDRKITVKKYKYDLGLKQVINNPLDLNQKEQAIITFKKIPATPGEEPFITVVEYWGNQTGPSQILSLSPGEYTIEGTLILYEEIIIPSEERDTGASWWDELLGADDTYTMPGMTFACTEDDCGYKIGEVRLNEITGTIQISEQNLYNNEEIVLYIMGTGIPTKIEHTSINFEELSSRYRNYLDPEYK